MAEKSENRARIDASLARARRRWLNAATVSAGGRWAVLPALLLALLGCTFALAFPESWVAPGIVAALALLAVGVTLVLTRRAFARPARTGAPDWALPLDNALALQGSLATLLDGGGVFTSALETQVAAALDERALRRAAPQWRPGAVLTALLLAVLPLIFKLPGVPESNPDEIARGGESETKPEVETEPPPDAEGAGSAGASSGAGSAEKGEGTEDEPGESSEGGAGEFPPDEEIQPDSADAPQPPEAGSEAADPPPDLRPDKKEKPGLDDQHIKPEPGDGETREETRRRLVYDENSPDRKAVTAAGASPRRIAEDLVPRMKLTTRERRRLETWFRKLNE